MYDPKFEKGVRQKMEELEFAPSDSAWANIEKAVTDRRRRRAFYFWRLAIPAMMLAGIVTVMYFAVQPVTSPPQAAAKSDPSANPASAKAQTPATLKTSLLAADPANTDSLFTPGADRSATKPAIAGKNGIASHPAPDPDLSAADRAVANLNIAPAPRGVPVAAHEEATANLVASKAGTGRHAAIAPYLFQSALAGQGSAGAVTATTLSAKKTTIALGTLQEKKRPWEAGFVAGGGISSLNHVSVNSTNNALAASLYNITNASLVPSKKYVSNIRSDASFLAGIYLQKPLSDRWTINLGMNLHYYSTRITIGEPVSTYVPATVSLISPTVQSSTLSSQAFIAGDRQAVTNHYYFLELPVNMQYRINKSHLLPLFVEGGVSLSRLMGSDALFYNPHSGVYYKDPGVLQKTQFNLNSSLLVGLPLHGIRIQAGPQLQYGLTPLINNNSQGDQHFLYAGLRVVVVPGRK